MNINLAWWLLSIYYIQKHTDLRITAMFTQMHIAKVDAIEAKIEMELMFLSEANKLDCLELIMGLGAEDRIVYLNQYVSKMAALMGTEAVADVACLMAA